MNILIMKLNREWFGKRWTKKFICYLDSLIFGNSMSESIPSNDYTFCRCFTIGLLCGIPLVILSLFFKDQSQVASVMAYIAFGLTLVTSLLYLVPTTKKLEGTTIKILRYVFVIVLNLIGCSAGFMLGLYLGVIIFLLFLGYLALCVATDTMSSKNSTSSQPRIVRRSRTRAGDGKYVNIEVDEDGIEKIRGDFGEEYVRRGFSDESIEEV